MANSFYNEAKKISSELDLLVELKKAITVSNNKLTQYTIQVEERIKINSQFDQTEVKDIHEDASKLVKILSKEIIEVYPLLGIKACSENHRINRIFKDYFTATQHHIFSKK